MFLTYYCPFIDFQSPQICTNTKSNYKCSCKEGFKKGEDGTCQKFTPLECDVKPQKPVIKAIKGNNVKVKLKKQTCRWEASVYHNEAK